MPISGRIRTEDSCNLNEVADIVAGRGDLEVSYILYIYTAWYRSIKLWPYLKSK